MKMVLRDKLRSTIIYNTDIMTSYLTKISQVHDELVVVGETMLNLELVRTSVNGFLEK